MKSKRYENGFCYLKLKDGWTVCKVFGNRVQYMGKSESYGTNYLEGETLIPIPAPEQLEQLTGKKCGCCSKIALVSDHSRDVKCREMGQKR